MNQKYTKKEKLKKAKDIELLFNKGESIQNNLFKLIFIEKDLENTPIKFGVTVSKKYFKKAVDRNWVKRRMRDCFRLNKELLIQKNQKGSMYMLIYKKSEKYPFKEMEKEYLSLLDKITF